MYCFSVIALFIIRYGQTCSHCSFGSWEPWGGCSQNCGGGIRKRERVICCPKKQSYAYCKKHIVIKRTMKYGNLQLVISTVTMVVYLTVAIVNVHLGGKVTAATKVIFIIFLVLLGLILLYQGLTKSYNNFGKVIIFEYCVRTNNSCLKLLLIFLETILVKEKKTFTGSFYAQLKNTLKLQINTIIMTLFLTLLPILYDQSR